MTSVIPPVSGSASSVAMGDFRLNLEALEKTVINLENRDALRKHWREALLRASATALLSVKVPECYSELLDAAWSSRLKDLKTLIISGDCMEGRDPGFDSERDSLMIYGVKPSIEAIGSIGQALKGSESLVALHFVDSAIDDDGVKLLSYGISENGSLKALYFHSNSLGDDSAIALAESLENNFQVEKLILRDNLIGDKGAERIGKMLSNKSMYMQQERGEVSLMILENQLQVLDLSKNKIADKGSHALAKGIAQSSYLSEIFLSGNPVSEKAEESLRKSVGKKLSLTVSFPSEGAEKIQKEAFERAESFSFFVKPKNSI